MIQYKKFKTVSKRYEMEVLSIISQYVGLNCDHGLSVILSNLRHDIEKIPRMSVGSAINFYSLEIVEDKIEIWHLDSLGNKDRLVCHIYDDGVKNKKFNF